MSWVFIRSEPGLYTVGFYDPDGNWNPAGGDYDWDRAVQQTAFLNGGPKPPPLGEPIKIEPVCPACGGTIHDHIDGIQPGPFGGDFTNYRCLVDELNDTISDMEHCDPPAEPDWIATLRAVRTAYRRRLGLDG